VGGQRSMRAEGSVGLEEGGMLVGVEVVVAISEHMGSKITHVRFGLYMQIAQHVVRAPVTQQLDDVAINVGTQEGHSTGGPERACRNVTREEAKGGLIAWLLVVGYGLSGFG